MKVTGLKEVQAALAQLADVPKEQKRAIKEGMIEAAQPIADDARVKAPRDEGDLANSIVVSDKVIKSQRGEVQRAGPEDVQLFIGPSYSKGSADYAPHAHLVEFGTGPRYHKSGQFVGQAPAQPFLRPAYDAGKVGFIGRFTEFMVITIEDAAKRVRKIRARGR